LIPILSITYEYASALDPSEWGITPNALPTSRLPATGLGIEGLDDCQQLWWANAGEFAVETVKLKSGRKMWQL